MSSRTKLTLDGHLTGVAVPISALRSNLGCGIGEFMDLPLLGTWCRQVGLDLIQILPVNDTGANPSPYSAVSAFALHPIYIRVQDLPGAHVVAGDLESFREGCLNRRRVDFEAVLAFKLEMLQRVFRDSAKPSDDLFEWIEENPWVRPYAVYKVLKGRHDDRAWEDWSVGRDPTPSEIHAQWHDLGAEALFHAWVQFYLDRQLRAASRGLQAQGICLKGDIPILMSVDSADVWAQRSFFDLSCRAGAPPDMFTRLGQMWGFPVYDWDRLEEQDFNWWRTRLEVASRYYHAFRIDHVLGFFRIWSVPATEKTAVLGRFRPSSPLSESEIREGIRADGLRHRVVGAWTTAETTAETLRDRSAYVLGRFFDLGHSGDFLLKPELESELAIEGLDEPGEVKEFLVQCHRSRTFLESPDGGFVPAWFWKNSPGYLLGDAAWRGRIEALVAKYQEASKPVWLNNGRRLLRFVKESGEMLPCAEDLGVVPPGLPQVLSDLGILSLKIERWETDDEGRLKDPSTFSFLSVSTPAVHDLSTLRGWWEEDDWDREGFCRDLGFDDCSPWLTTDLAMAILKRSLRSNSAIRVFQIQDLFALTIDLRTAGTEEERINIPGSVGKMNWSYTLPIPLEELPEHEISRLLTELFADAADERARPQTPATNR